MGFKEDGVLPPSQLAILLPHLSSASASDTSAVPVANTSSSSSSTRTHDSPRSPSLSSLSADKPSDKPTAVAGSSKAPPATREKPEIERYARSNIEQGPRRVFLLGEQRWEDPDRILPSNQTSAAAAAAAAAVTAAPAGGPAGGSPEEGKIDMSGGGKWRFLEIDEASASVEVSVRASVQMVTCYECRGDGRIVCMGERRGTGLQ